MLRIALLASAFTLPLRAQDGGQLYTLYCSACHGADGKGATGGQFPPLAGSDWVQGDPARSVKIVLHGLHGEVEVDGRKFNLEMPPQGAVLPDDQIAAILTFARSSWGNKSDAIAPAFVTATRDANTDRKAPWTAAEILKLHPLPPPTPPIANLISQVYEGDWQQLPDFSKLKASNVEEEHDGRISIAKAGFNELFGMTWEGDITAPESGSFTFRLDADDGARVIIDGQKVAEVNGTGPMDGGRAQEGDIKLSAGVHKIRVEYFEYKGNEGIALAWKGPGLQGWKNLSDKSAQGGREPIMIIPQNGRAVIYRNFIADTTPRAIGVGFPGGLNLAYSADHLAGELIWTGDFMDASRHWVDRGQGDQPPAGNQIEKLSGSAALPRGSRFRGYKLDPAGNPTFAVQIGDQVLLDTWKPGTFQTHPALVRELSLGEGSSSVEILISDKYAVKMTDDQDFELGPNLHVHAEGFYPETRDGKSYLKLPAGRSATLNYRWK